MKQDLIYFATKVSDESPVYLDEEYLIEHRMQILGNSGSGKSRMIRNICEKTKGKFQQIIISPKSEFVTLREKFDYLHVGRTSEITKPDIELNTRYAGQLALKLLETGMDTIIEFSEAPLERIKFVKNFIDALMSAPAHLWHPVMIVIDEIDIWAPEKGHGEAESLQSIVDLAARGRDRGLFLVAATQKLAKFNKDVASELDIKLVGKVSLDVDQDRAAKELGIPIKQKGELRWLGAPNYHFYAFGPGLSDEVIKIKSLDVETTHISGWKKNKKQKPIPTPDKIKQLLTAFSDLPQEAEKEIKTLEDHKKKIQELNAEIRNLKHASTISSAPKIDPQAMQKAEQIGFQKGFKECERQMMPFVKTLKTTLATCGAVFLKITSLGIDAINEDIANLGRQMPDLKVPEGPREVFSHVPPMAFTKIVQSPFQSTNSLQIDSGGVLAPAELRVLYAILQCRNHRGTKKKIAIMCEYAESGGAFRNIKGRLRASGYVQYEGDDLVATEKAVQEFPNHPTLPDTPDEIFQHWCSKLAPAEVKIFTVIFNAQSPISKDAVAGQAGYDAAGGAFRNIMGRLRTLGLIEYLPDKMVRTSREIME